MTLTVRVLLGALFGAVGTLCVHPYSRPYMTAMTSRVSPDAIELCVDSYAKSLPDPSTLPEAGLWMQLATQRIQSQQLFTFKEMTSLLALAQVAEKRDATNAFWPQMQAILYDSSGDLQKAKSCWMRAARRPHWNDYQTTRLMQDREEIKELTGNHKSWQLAFLYYARSNSFAYCFEGVARKLLAKAPFSTPAGLETRYATLQNADLLRSNARSTATNVTASNVVDLSAMPTSMSQTVSPRRLNAGVTTLKRNFTTILGRPGYTERASKIFSYTESWRALTVHASNDEQAATYAVLSVVISSAGCAALAIAGCGLAVWVVGYFVKWRLSRLKDVNRFVAGVIAAALGTLVYFLTDYFPAAAAMALCAAFLTVAPDRSRKVRPPDMGPLFSFTGIALGIVCASMLGSYLVASSAEANLILPNANVPASYFDSPVMAGAATVAFGLVLLMAPMWAVVNRLGTPYVLSLALSKVGSTVFVMGLSLSIALGPLSVYYDRRLEAILYQLVTNEPLHYYVQQ